MTILSITVKPRCGAPMRDGLTGEPSKCGRVLGHAKEHASIAAVERARQRVSERTARLMATESVCISRDCSNVAPPGALTCRRCMAASRLARYRRLREAFLDLYGRQCQCCGSAENLSLDHVLRDGKEHRARYRPGSGVPGDKIYRDAVTEYRPDRYRTLCRGCNTSASHYPDNQCRREHR
jgi:hypothetical protein